MSDANKRHKRVFNFFGKLMPVFMKRKYNIENEIAPKIDSPYIVLSNHTSNLDSVLVGMSFPRRQMYFVASEHLFRIGFISFLLKRYFAPISRMKGGTDASTALNVIRQLRKGYNVCLFAEGNRSFNGVTCDIHPATAKLVKSSGATLVTYKLTGGYLSTPRWALFQRRGKMTGRVEAVYSPEQLKRLSVEEIHEIIKADLYENAYERQEKEHIAFKGRKLAEGLEAALYVCPCCKKIGTLHSKDDRFFCDSCDMSVAYNEYGELVGNAPYKNVLDWDKFQAEHLRQLSRTLEDKTAFSDDGYVITEIGARHKAKAVDKGRLSVSLECLSCGETSFKLSDISDMNIILRNTLMFTVNDRHFELTTKKENCSRKYLELYKIIKSNEQGETL